MFENLNIDKRCKEEIENAVKNSKLSHAVILEGADEKTRYEAAREIAKALVCSGESEKPCDICRNCKKAENNCHPDIHYLQKDQSSASIKVDEIREIKKAAQLFPNEAKCSVFIILQAQELGVPAQNALLKIFEEPAPHVKFILCCNSKSSFLETITSRSTSYCLLQNDDYSYGENEKNELAFDLSKKLLECLCDGDEFSFLSLTASFGKDRELFVLTMNSMIAVLRDAAVLLAGSNITISQFADTAKRLTVRFSQEKLLSYISICSKLSDSVKANANISLVSTMLSSEFYDIKLK